jgi:hypothetical protein
VERYGLQRAELRVELHVVRNFTANVRAEMVIIFIHFICIF